MPSTILSDNGASSGTAGIKTTGSNDGQLALQTTTAGGTATTAITIDTSQNVGIGVTPNTWTGTNSKSIQFGSQGTIAQSATYGMITADNVHYNSGWKYTASNFASALQQTDGKLILKSAPSGTAGNTITWTDVVSVEKAKSLALEGASSQTGTGITFPATQSASTDANTLDDYEQGTWTPAFGVTSGSATYTNQVGYYVKVGRMVTVTFYITVNVSSSLVCNGTITGLPFSGSNTNYAGASFSVYNTAFGGYCNVLGLAAAAATTIQLRSTATANAAPVGVAPSITNGTEIAGSLTYFAAD